MRRTIAIGCLALLSLVGCSETNPVGPQPQPELSDPDITPAFALTLPRARVWALGRHLEVEVLESNSDFVNHIWLVSPHEMFIATDDDTGAVIPLPDVRPLRELVFEIRVHDPDGNDTGMRWRTGPPWRNVDGEMHAIVVIEDDLSTTVSMEDIDASGWGEADEPNFIDAVFSVRRR